MTMNKPKDKGNLLNTIQSAVASYSYYCDDKNFKIVVEITEKDGFINVEEQK